MATRSISVELLARVQGFVSGLRTAQQAVRDTGSRLAAFARENEQHMDRVGKAGMLMGGTLLAGVGLAVKAASEFDSAMSEVRASTHETAANMDLLRQAAINAGADTSFSAKEAAGAIDELAKAGVSTKEVLGGGLAGALSLAAAGSLQVGDAAEIAATAMTQFKLGGKDIPHVADLLAAGAGKAQGSVEDIGMALKQSGLVASQFGLSIEDTTGTLAAFASAGLIGSDSGTSLKTMLLALANPSNEAANKMAELGIAAYDANGKFVGIRNLSGQLKEALSDQSQASRDAAMATIFGSDAIRAANVLYKQGADGISDWIDKVNDSGFAAVTASIKQDNLAGDVEKLGGSFDSLLIKSGSGLSESLRGLVQGAESVVDAMGRIPAPIMNATVGIAGITGGALLLGGALVSTVPKLVEFHGSLNKIAPAGSRAGNAIRSVGKAAGIATAALIAMQIAGAVFSEKDTKSAEDFGQALLKVANAGKNADGKGLDSVFKGFDKFAGQDIVTNVDSLAGAVERLTHQTLDDGGNKFFEPLTNLLGLPKGEISQLEERFKGLGESMGDLVKNGSAETAAESFKLLTQEFEKNGKGAQEALAAVPGYKDALLDLANQSGVVLEGQDLIDFALGKVPASMEAAATATQTYTNAAGQATPITEDMAKKLEDLGISAQGAIVNLANFTDALINAGLLQLSARDAARNYQEAIDGVAESIAKNGTTMDINTEQGRANQAALDAVASAGLNVMKANAANGASQQELQGNLRGTYNSLITAAGQFGITGGQADALARKVLGIPPKANIDSWMSDAAKRMAEQTTSAVNGIPSVKNVTVNTTYNETTIQRVIRQLSTEPDKAPVGAGTVLAPKKAIGGAIIGPGTGTSDDIMAMLSNGEHVLTAEEVRLMGGQAAVYRMRAMLKAGTLPKFAAGGAADKATARRNFWIDYQKDTRRGTGYRSVVDSLSSAYSFTDRLTTLADSGNVSAASIRNLYTAAGKGEGALRTLHARADKLSTALEKAKDRVTTLSQTRDSIRGKLNEEFSIGDAMKKTSPFSAVTVQGIQGAANAVLARIRNFGAKLNKLRAMGYSGQVLEEIAGLGSVEGMVAADALLKGSKTDVKNLNGVYNSIDSASKAAGTYVTDAMYKGGINAANGLVKGLASQQKAIEKQMLSIGLGMEKALKAALGIKSPSRKAAAIGDNFAGTLAKRLEVGKGNVAKHAGALGDAMSVVPKAYAPAVAYRPVPNVASASAATPADVRVYIGNEQIDARVVHVASGVVTQADGQSKYTRTGGR
ncbi:tail length tape measure protein [Arthrobacter phage Persistence]|uniref:Tape measure protein n=1 Tax=Arthrobacter phage Persistence TaxID=2836007 RepID=A0A8F3E7S2_9CAUD|nr:tail length tape measure protein [Arthrobacter phage Persistence]QWY79648.1 tape measure protein [Arthrobacter phage Persistence]